jgi:hypothetical protein
VSIFRAAFEALYPRYFAFGGGGDGGGVGEIDGHVADIKAFGRELGGCFFPKGLVARAKQNGAAGCGELAGDFEADAFVRSRDQRDFLR